jgi:macrolide transport system ATP-binding/permease protein
MIWARRFWLRLQTLFRSNRIAQMLDDEIQFHLEQQIAENLAAGMNPVEARQAATRTFGNPMLVKQQTSDLWGWLWVEHLTQDLRYAVRVLGKSLSFAAVAILAVALGVGVNTGTFSVLNGVALKQLPVPRAEQIVSVDQVFHGKFRRNLYGEPGLFSYSEYENYRANSHVFSGLLAYAPFLGDVPLGGDRPEQLMGVETSCNFFEVLDERPALGRTFVADDCRAPGASAVVVLSDDLWRSRFGADPQIVGKSISLNRTKFVVIGIAARGFNGLDPWPSQFWAPVTMQKALEPDTDLFSADNTGWLALLGRMQPGVPLSQVRVDLGLIAARIDQQYPGRTTTLAIRRATFMGRSEERSTALSIGAVLLAAVGLVLLIACANVANLLLARASARQKEIAVRLSIGAGRGRIIRQLLTESLLIAFLGGTLGSLLAFWSAESITRYLLAHLPSGFPRLMLNVSPDLHVWGYSLALTTLTGIVFGLAPALHATRQDLSTAVKGDSEGLAGKAASGGMLRSTFIGVQMAVSMILLIAAGLLLRGLYVAQTADPGFEMKGITQARYDLPSQGYKQDRAQAFQRELIARVAALPGVDEVEQARAMPLGNQFLGTGLTPTGETQERQFEFNVVSPGFFAMLGMPMARGRTFTESEAQSEAPVAIVTEFTARRLWPGQDPIGKTMHDEKKEYQVVGVVKDSQASHLGHTDGLFIYMPAGPTEQSTLQLLVRSKGRDVATIDGIRETARTLDPDLIVNVAKLQDNLELWRTPSRIVASLSSVLGALALLLAAIGVHGVVSYGVSRRIREIGIRMTLGADRREMVTLVLRQALRPVVIGVAVGIGGCAAVSQVLSDVLYGVGLHDPIAFIGMPLFLLGVAFLASYIPARRASRVEPMVALRYE